MKLNLKVFVILATWLCIFEAKAGPIQDYYHKSFWEVPKGATLHIKIDNPEGTDPIEFVNGKIASNVYRITGGYCSIRFYDSDKPHYSVDLTATVSLGGYPYYACPIFSEAGRCSASPIDLTDLHLDTPLSKAQILCNVSTVADMLSIFGGAIY